MTTETIFTLAKQMSEAFDGGKRDNGDSFRKLKDGSPEWMSDIVREAHNEMMPDACRLDVRQRISPAMHRARFDGLRRVAA